MGDSSLCKANAFDPKVTNSALCRNELVSKTRQRRNNVWKQSAITFSTSSRTWSAEAKTLHQTKTKMDLHAKAVSLGLTHLKDWKHTWRRFTIWQSSAKKTRKESGKTGAGKQRKREKDNTPTGALTNPTI